MEELRSLLLGNPASVAAAVALATALGFGGWRLGPRLGWDRRWTAFTGAWLGLVIGLTVVRIGVVVPPADTSRGLWSMCLWNPGLGVGNAEDLVNVVMLAPFAFGLTLASRRWWLGLAVSVVLIGVVEIAQAILGTGVCEAGDATRNLLGAMIGVGVGVGVGGYVLRRTARDAPGAA